MSKTRAAIYLRISRDFTGEELAIQRQREECLRIVKSRGWTLADGGSGAGHGPGEYVDNSVSASDARKQRPGYDALAKAYAAGAFDALVCYDLDRLTRQPRQLEDWIDAAEGRGLALVTANGEADLTTDGGRMYARIKAAVARGEIERKSARQKSAAVQRADNGRPPLGVRLTGYSAKGDLVPDEAALVARTFKMFHAGDSLRGIARTFNEEAVTTRHGKPWNPSTVRGILVNPRYAGRAVYQGKPTGKRGVWEAIVDDATFDAVQARLSDARRKTSRQGTERKHLGSGLYLCDECEVPVSGWSGGRYRCRDGAHVNRARGPVDGYVLARVAGLLETASPADLIAETEADSGPVLAEISRQQKRLEAVEADYDDDLIDGRRYKIKKAKIESDMRAAEARLAAIPNSSGLAEILASPDPVAAFDEAGLMRQRAIIDALFVVRLRKGTRYSRTFGPETVRVARRALA
ncbi:recombinase family protein [Nocardioides sp. NPDC006303]|uniref:recombinase family protein n=1 Tax=Nocardioides sp. NPDC006303 TaxID=3156747 RepID=UPI0033A0993C